MPAFPHVRQRMLLAGLLSCAVGAALAQDLSPRPGSPQTEQLAADTFAFRQGAQRSLFLVGSEGVIVTDPVSPDHAAAMRRAIAEVTDQPVRYVVYSNSHWNRIAGGRIFRDEGAKFVTQQGCAENLRETPNPLVITPDITYRDSYRVEVGDRALELHYLGPSLDTCLSVIIAQPAKLMMVVGLVNPPQASLPWNPTVPDYQLWNILPFFQAAEDLARREGITRLVGGFASTGAGVDGKPVVQPATGPVTVLAAQHQLWARVLGDVKAQLDAGTPARAITGRLDLQSYQQYPRYSERNMAILVRRVVSLHTTGR
ncbi:MAG: hypothetical protein IT485_06105 [Gammaproteobacteria bacterium]|nr:hypothetical protein [Gammaproteobacteria bacterium]QOJ33098.1 MAG: hypothetical protein HRU81_13740 [Gammaproteobacteria bacterium]